VRVASREEPRIAIGAPINVHSLTKWRREWLLVSPIRPGQAQKVQIAEEWQTAAKSDMKIQCVRNRDDAR
jgi:hypothetical protein